MTQLTSSATRGAAYEYSMRFLHNLNGQWCRAPPRYAYLPAPTRGVQSDKIFHIDAVIFNIDTFISHNMVTVT
jgi:hypothetical protein